MELTRSITAVLSLLLLSPHRCLANMPLEVVSIENPYASEPLPTRDLGSPAYNNDKPVNDIETRDSLVYCSFASAAVNNGNCTFDYRPPLTALLPVEGVEVDYTATVTATSAVDCCGCKHVKLGAPLQVARPAVMGGLPGPQVVPTSTLSTLVTSTKGKTLSKRYVVHHTATVTATQPKTVWQYVCRTRGPEPLQTST